MVKGNLIIMKEGNEKVFNEIFNILEISEKDRKKLYFIEIHNYEVPQD